MFRSLVLAGGICAVAACAANAADFPVRGVMPAGAVACPAAAFQGWYAGVNGGGIAWTANRTDQDAFVSEAASYVQNKSGWVGGGQLGYNLARCNVVFGVEIDGDWSNTSVTTSFLPNAGGFDLRVQSKFNGIILGKYRAGLALDNVLLYVVGGPAAARFDTTYVVWGPAAPFIATTDINQWRYGWSAGFGTDIAWTDRISIRSEVMYANFPDREYRQFIVPVPAPGVAPFFSNFTHSDSMWISKIGLNVRLGPVASYR